MSDPDRTPDVYAIPGKLSIIDQIDPITGRTCILHQTAAEVFAREPRAVRMTWRAWQAAAVAQQQAPIRWQPTTAREYQRMLEILPPVEWSRGAFLVGEPIDHCFASGAPRFTGYRQQGGRYWVASRPITVAELRQQLQGTTEATL